MPPSEDTTGSLERARERLYEPSAARESPRAPLGAPGEASLPHVWVEDSLRRAPGRKGRHAHFAGIFFIIAFSFFLISLAAVAYFFYFGGNSVSVDKISVNIQGPTTIAGGDTVPLSLSITNRNPATLEDVTVEMEFPEGTRSAADMLEAYPRHTERLGALKSGETVTLSLRAVMFGGAGQTLVLPVSLSYGTAGSNATFIKKTSYTLAVSSTPLSLSVETFSETVSGQSLTFMLTVRSNAAVPLDNVVLASALPFGFTVTSSSLPLTNSDFFLGTLAPGASKELTLSGILVGQDTEQRVFRFTVGTGSAANTQTIAVPYMEQEAIVTITAPFLYTTLALDGDPSLSIVAPGSHHSAMVSYRNTLPTSVANAAVAITLSGSALDYNSIQTVNGFYRSADRTVVFSRDTDPALATLAPGASGLGSFTFAVLPAAALAPAPTVTFSISVSGTRVGQTSVPEEVRISATKTVKVATAVLLTSSASHSSGPFGNSGPIPPQADQATTYAIVWNVKNTGSAVAGGTASALLPSYVSYAGRTSGQGAFIYDETSRTVSWNIGDLAQGASAQGAFQISLTPSVSQKGTAPQLIGPASFSGYDRFAGVQVRAAAEPATTETKGDSGYVLANAIVQ